MDGMVHLAWRSVHSAGKIIAYRVPSWSWAAVGEGEAVYDMDCYAQQWFLYRDARGMGHNSESETFWKGSVWQVESARTTCI